MTKLFGYKCDACGRDWQGADVHGVDRDCKEIVCKDLDDYDDHICDECLLEAAGWLLGGETKLWSLIRRLPKKTIAFAAEDNGTVSAWINDGRRVEASDPLTLFRKLVGDE